MQNSVDLSQFFTEKVDIYLNLFEFYAKEEKAKILDLMKETIENDFVKVCQKTKIDIMKHREKLNYTFPLEFQLQIFDKNIFTYVSFMVQKFKQS